ncbi:WD40 repeat domain-containing protein [Novipirellula sp. SH528]|uniref:WD40 repeat domain-containing protein n=1 Tax=Novipirellula sp. SH528 TaxID=3454466 RepID=UPI003FA18A51
MFVDEGATIYTIQKTLIWIAILAAFRFIYATESTVQLTRITESRVLNANAGPVLDIAISPDGSRIASAHDGGNVSLWDAETGRKIKEFAAHDLQASAVCFAPDGRTLSTGGADYKVKLWDIHNLSIQKTYEDHDDTIIAIEFSPDGETLVSTGGSHVKLRNLLNDKIVRDVSTGDHAVAFSPDGSLLALPTGPAEYSLNVWDGNATLIRHELTGHDNFINDFVFSPDGTFLASVDNDHIIKLWDMKCGSLIRNLTKAKHFAFSIAISPDGKTLASGSGINYFGITLWDTESGAAKTELKGHTELIGSVAFAPNSKTLVSASLDGTVRLWTLPAK